MINRITIIIEGEKSKSRITIDNGDIQNFKEFMESSDNELQAKISNELNDIEAEQ